MSSRTPKRPFRSRHWFALGDRPDMTALYTERYMAMGLTPAELRSGAPIIGIAQSGAELNPCNAIHLKLESRIKDGVRAAGGVPISFPVHTIFEECRRPTAALDRNLTYLALVESLHGYFFDAVVLTTGCDKTTPAAIMAAATVDIPAIVLNGGPMLDGWLDGKPAGAGTVIWRARRALGAGEIDEEEFFEAALSSSPSLGHCNSMGTASTMNAVAEAMGLALPGSSAIPAVYGARAQMAFETGRRIVDLAYDDLKPSDLITRASCLNALKVVSAIGGSSNAQPHLQAIARHAGVDLRPDDWTAEGQDIPLLVNMQPAGEFLSERFYRAGGVPAVMWELLQAGQLDGRCLTVTGRTVADNVEGREATDRAVIYPYDRPLKERAGYLVLRGNLFDFAILKTSVISDAFRARYLSRPGHEGAFEARAIVFDGSEDYHARINDPALAIDEDCILVMRGAGPIGWPGSAEVVNMQPPDALLKRGIMSLPTLGDGRQSGTSDSPSILNASPESAVGGGLAWLRTGDTIRVDLNAGRCDAVVDAEEIARRRAEGAPPVPPSATPWEALFREKTGQMETGAVLEFAVEFREVGRNIPRHNH